jgi:NAD(P) transhydrogenase subunit alpha
MLTVFVPRESREGEARVAATPDSVKKLAGPNLRIVLERGAGERAGFPDAAYQKNGAELSGPELLQQADLVLKVQPPTAAEAARLKQGAILIAFLQPARELELVAELRARGVTALAMELVPRITRAQAMDALSSQATVAGYKAVLLGATHMRKMCPLLMTAAGTVPPAKVVVFGAGVAGLMAIATARRLGCVVEATDVRAAAKEQVESLGGRFITVPGAADMEGAGGYAREQSEDFLRRQREEVARRVAEADLVITTAQVPGKKAPVLVTRDMVRAMKPGAVIVDLAVESGGNCELSERDRVVVKEGVTLVGIANLPSSVPQQASELYARNVLALVRLFLDKEGHVKLDFADEVLAGCRLTHAGEVHHAPTAEALEAAAGGPR